MTNRKPTFNVSEDGTTVEVDGTTYFLGLADPMDVVSLRRLNFDGYFGMTALRGQLDLIHSAHVNDNYENRGSTEGIVKVTNAFRSRILAADTIFYLGRGLNFAIDYPKVEGGKIDVSQRSLESCLGSKQIGRIYLSDDGLVRAIPYEGKSKRTYSSNEMVESDYPLFLTGNEEAPHQIAGIIRSLFSRGKIIFPQAEDEGLILVPALMNDVNDNNTVLLSYIPHKLGGISSFLKIN